MVDRGTWNSLRPEEQAEYQALQDDLINAVHATGLQYGSDFAARFRVVCVGPVWRISDGAHWLRGIESTNRAVIDALYKDACMNLGR